MFCANERLEREREWVTIVCDSKVMIKLWKKKIARAEFLKYTGRRIRTLKGRNGGKNFFFASSSRLKNLAKRGEEIREKYGPLGPVTGCTKRIS